MGRISKYPNKAGIYKLTCIENGKVYIGKSVNIRIRLSQHKTSKSTGILQRAIIKYGWESFNFEVLEIIEDFDKNRDNNLLLERESFFINLYESSNVDKGYNICEYSTDRTGIVCSEETKEKMRQARLGTKASDETRMKLSQANLGKKLSEETKEKMRNRKLSDEHKEKIGQSNLGKNHSEESKEKMSKSKKGRQFSEDHKEKLRNAKLGKTLSQEHKDKLSKSLLGKEKSLEHKQNIKNNHWRNNKNES